MIIVAENSRGSQFEIRCNKKSAADWRKRLSEWEMRIVEERVV